MSVLCRVLVRSKCFGSSAAALRSSSLFFFAFGGSSEFHGRHSRFLFVSLSKRGFFSEGQAMELRCCWVSEGRRHLSKWCWRQGVVVLGCVFPMVLLRFFLYLAGG
uniref:Uncharacterized protein n=1 Tax=Physcomitrium patens TaxID=3218 RepID=A0A2K1K5X1_PHYPA|nr:hypothetical protein PHYPA_011064 [Physcomitrium patens]